MPELPEVETVVQGLKKQCLSQPICKALIHLPRIVNGTAPSLKKALVGQEIVTVTRHGKYIFLHISNDKTVVVHLRMTGQLFTTPVDRAKDKHTHVELFFDNSDTKLIYRDIRTFGRFTLINTSDKERYLIDHKLGPDALTMKKKDLIEALKNRKVSIKAALLNQEVIAGIGNIYVDEILFREKLNPLTTPSSLSDDAIGSILKTTKAVLKKAVLNKGTTFSDYVNSYGEKGKFQLSLKAYNRAGQPCSNCKTTIVKVKVAGRGTYFCPSCQKL
ncbi:MAG: bifunctional DNA-formamidopyrimidine glycosylase/DNA-(apurinic or apyrimidinic site) lyase [Fibrobacterales bacterium]